MGCKYCGGFVSPERAEIKPYCMSKACVAQGLSEKKFAEVGYGKSGVDLVPVHAVSAEELARTGNRGR